MGLCGQVITWRPWTRTGLLTILKREREATAPKERPRVLHMTALIMLPRFCSFWGHDQGSSRMSEAKAGRVTKFLFMTKVACFAFGCSQTLFSSCAVLIRTFGVRYIPFWTKAEVGLVSVEKRFVGYNYNMMT